MRRVLDRDAYIAEVITNLKLRELCALYDGVEVAVKNSNRFSEQRPDVAGVRALSAGD